MLRPMNIVINEELRLYIDPLTPDEYAALERSLLAEGCRDALVLWGDLLVDGHNRYGICQKHGIPFNTVQNTRFQNLDDVRLWMIENHLGRRSVSDYQRGVLALRKKEILQARAPAPPAGEAGADAATAETAAAPEPVLPNRQALAREARVSSNTLTQIDRIRQQAAPELVEAVRAGEISINAAAAVATLPPERQKEAVRGGRKELRMTAREVRQTVQAERTRARREARGEEAGAPADGDPPFDPDGSTPVITDYPAEVARLNKVIQRLTEERDGLKQRVMHLTVALAEARNKP
ncbi:hypothetical protein CEG14_12920 [Bordetella genomosp. 1]|uniref:Plasmid replication/partition related protein n=1 Tax=Bordetella genomosp. 1 TaxID=1395607 RepID=A0A261SGK6_9BORD|nr:hypothetical protein CEG14_12920 [Bordetella genomosp. 1]